jgi:hypothetical protein
MRRAGNVLMGLGLTLGAAVCVALLLGFRLTNLPWLVAVGLVKLTLISAVGLIAGGAVVRRLGIRAEHRALSDR